MTWIDAGVWVFWGFVVLATVRTLVAAKLSSNAETQVNTLRAELQQLRIKDRLESLETGQLTLSNKVESAKVTQLRSRKGWG